jgi:biopolymer transport protein ExbD
MITAPLLTQGIKVELPKLNAGSLETQNTISIHVLRSREIFVEVDGSRKRIPLANFEKDFSPIYRRHPVPVILNADKNIPYGIVMQIIGRLKEIGVEQLGFLTDPVESQDALQSLKL